MFPSVRTVEHSRFFIFPMFADHAPRHEMDGAPTINGATMSQIQKITNMLQKLEQDKFYGRLELQFRAGAIELVRQEKTIKFSEGNNPNGSRF